MDFNDLNTTDSSLSEYGGGDEQQQASLPLGVGGFDGQGGDPLIGIAEDEGKSRAGQLLLVLVVVVAAAGLFFMRTLARVTIAATSADNERMLEEFLDQRDDSSPQEGIADLREKSSSVLENPYPNLQVPLNELQKNPFVILQEDAGGEVIDAEPGELEYNRRVRDAEQAYKNAFARLQLKSVLAGSNPVANISGNIVRTDDTVSQDGVTFTVKQITTDTAVLEARDDALALVRTYTLQIERP